MASEGSLGGLTSYFVYVLIVSTIGPLLFGFHLAELNPPQAVITCVAKSISTSILRSALDKVKNITGLAEQHYLTLPQCIPMDDAQFAVVTSFFTLGGLVGALASGPASNRFGRLRIMTFTTAFFILGSAVEALAIDISTMTIGRFLSGIGAGASVVVVPIYIAESAPQARRGLFGTFTQVMVNVGILVAQILGYFLSHDSYWRIILAVGGAFGLAQLVGLLLGGQESPKWLGENGKPSKARRALQRLRGRHVNIEEEVAAWKFDNGRDLDDEEETLLARDEIAHDQTKPVDESDATTTTTLLTGGNTQGRRATLGVITVLRHPEPRQAIFVVVMIMLAQQLTGINSIVMYGVRLLADLLQSNASLLNIAVAALNIITTVIAAPLVDKIGRKTCLLISITGMGVNSVLLGISIMNHLPLLSVISALLFVASFGLGLGPVPFILSAELVHSEAVGATQSWALAANWSATFVVAQFFPILNNIMGKGQVYFIFAGFALFFGLFTLFYVPESNGKRDPDEVWGRGKAAARVD